ncbi:MAG: gamma-glutamyltransferase, partial [Thermoleophilaceae bacterium]|nr:gamma-glutamyltransferase [Thermoleophilaceae bacterium]
GTLIAASLLGLSQSSDVDALALVRASEAANRARDDGFSQHLHDADFFETFLAGLGRGSDGGGPGETDVVGSTTHISVLDANGMAVSCTCSNGSGSGVAVPGTGVILNNMLGETDLNPLGVGRTRPSARITSMMAPTIVLRDGNPQLVLGSAGSNRIRSAILQVIAHVVDHGMSVEQAVNAPRVHFEDGVVQAEPGIGEEQLAALEAAGLPIVHWAKQNLFFGGCQAVGRSTSTSTFEGAGDPRRGGVAILA